MNIKGWYNVKLLKTVHYLSYVGLIAGLYLMFTGVVHWAPFLIATFLISNIGESAALHRYFTHNSFKTGPIRHWLLAFLGTITTQGSIVHWVAMHRIHHKHADTENDPVDPAHIGFWRSVLGIVDPEDFKRINAKLVIDKLRDKTVMWFHNWYWPIIATYVVVLAVLSPQLVLSCYLMPVAIVRINLAINNTVNHGYFKSIGYQNFPGKDRSTNSILFHFITLFSGESLHNNHHYNAGRYSFQERWWEIDPTALFIKYFLITNPQN